MDGERDIWIMKPAGSSRGRGICLQKNLNQIMEVCRQHIRKYVVQKYIENSMIVMKRKFDIRQWVLVTDWNPLTVWLYQEPYIRFAAADFSYKHIHNRYAHLSNSSVGKHADSQRVTHDIDGNMWSLDDF